MVPFILLLSVLYHTISSSELVYSNYELTFPTDNCKRGQQLLAYDDNINESQPICSRTTVGLLTYICEQVNTCNGSTGIITNSSSIGKNLLVIDQDHVAFYSTLDCSLEVLCYQPDTQCILPNLEYGAYAYTTNGSRYEDGVLDEGEKLAIACNTGYTWYWSNYISCIKMNTGSVQLSSDPTCVPLPDDFLMQLHFNVSNTTHMSLLTGVPAKALTNVEAVEGLIEEQCGNTTSASCSIPIEKFYSAKDQLPLLLANYSGCFQTTILSLFLMGLQSTADIDLFPEYDTRPAKRDITTKLLNVRLSSLELTYGTQRKEVEGVTVRFYLFHYVEALSPSIVTKVMGHVSRDKYDVVLESYCRLTHCTDDDYYSEECQKIPSMFFNSYPKPSTPCVYQGNSLDYGEAVPLTCTSNEYIQEDQITVCVFGRNYSPDESPMCAECGGMVHTDSITVKSPSRANGRNARGAKCVWEIDMPHRNRGQFYTRQKTESWIDCDNPVNYLKITELDGDGIVTKENTEVCLEVNMRLSGHFKIEFTSNNISELHQSFSFFFEADLPPLPWYKKYLAILIAAPAIVIFFSGLVFLGMYCDNRNKKKDDVIDIKAPVDVEHGDQTSNGTWKPNSSFKENTQHPDGVGDDETISPTPRVHNAVTGPERRRKKKRKKRVTPNKTTDSELPEDGTVSRPPAYAWVLSNGTATDTVSPEPETYPDRGASQVFPSPQGPQPVTQTNGETEMTQTTECETIIPAKPRKKRRKKKRTDSLQRPLPSLNDDVAAASRDLPPLQNNFAKEPGGRALPPITIKGPDVDEGMYPFVSDDLGID